MSLKQSDAHYTDARFIGHQIVATFVTELNPHRTFAGTNVEVIGRITRIPHDHSHQATGRNYHLTLNNGTILIFEPDGRPSWPVDTKLGVSGQLIGIRECDDERDPDWGSVNLHPGIRLGAMESLDQTFEGAE